jgi:hypothetical protein
LPALLFVVATTACDYTTGTTPHDAAVDMPRDSIDANVCADWCRRKPITIHAAKVAGGPHVAFPVLVDLAADAELQKFARADGRDIRFTDENLMSALPYERVAYDSATGALHAWVRVPVVTSATDTTIYMHYGYAAAEEQHNPPLTWSSGYAGVWHFDTGGIDSTINANSAMNLNGAAFGQRGKLQLGASFDGVDDRLRMAGSSALDVAANTGTISTWIRFVDTTQPTNQFITASSNNSTPPQSSIEWSVDNGTGEVFVYPRRGDGTNAFNEAPPPFTNDTWHLAAVTLDFSTRTAALFADGVRLTLTTENVPSMWMNVANPDDWLWGSHPGFAAPFEGNMDEIRVSSVVRSDAWLATEFSNQSDPAVFSTVGAEEAD